jgi:hypothetical protein
MKEFPIHYDQDSLKKNGPKREIFIADTLLQALTEKLVKFPSLWKDIEQHLESLLILRRILYIFISKLCLTLRR